MTATQEDSHIHPVSFSHTDPDESIDTGTLKTAGEAAAAQRLDPGFTAPPGHLAPAEEEPYAYATPNATPRGGRRNQPRQRRRHS